MEHSCLRFPATIHADWSATVRSILFIFIFLGFIDDSHAQSPHWSIGTGATPMALAGDYRALGWNPAQLTFSPLNDEWKSAMGGMEGGLSLRSTVFEREDLWNDIWNREGSTENWTGLERSEWVHRLSNEEIQMDGEILTAGTAKKWGKWGVAYTSRNVISAEAFLSSSTAELLIEGGAAEWFELVITASGDTVPNSGDWDAIDLLTIVGGLDTNEDAILSELLQDSRLGFSWHRAHEVGISKEWGSKKGWTIHTGIGGKLLLGNGFFQLRDHNGELDAFGAFSNGLQIPQLDSLNSDGTGLDNLRKWGPVGQGFGLDFGVVIEFSDQLWASCSITDIGWMEWRGERYSIDGMILDTWNEAATNPAGWMDVMSNALNPSTWFSQATKETRRIPNGVGFHIGGGYKVGEFLTLAADATFDNQELLGNAGTRLGTSALLNITPLFRFDMGIRKLGGETFRFPAGFVFKSGKSGLEIGLQAGDIQGLWKSTQPELAAHFCFLRWVW